MQAVRLFVVAVVVGLVAVLGGSAGVAKEALPSGETSGGVTTVTEGASAERPNIVLFLTDDQPPYTLRTMPEVRGRIVARGTIFDQTFSSYPLCCPGRATIQRGQYAFNHGVVGNSAPYGGWSRFDELDLEQSTIATWLDDAGYKTGYFGKYINEYETAHVPPGWDRWHVQVGEYDGSRVNEDGRVHDYSSDIHKDAYYSRKAVEWLDQAVQQEESVFAQIGFSAPHSPANYQQEYADEFSVAEVPRTPDFNERDLSDKPYSRDRLTSEEVVQADAFHRRQLRSLQTVDETVRKAITTVRSRGELENTYFIFYTDNGYHNGHHRFKKGKLEPYRTDTRFPLLVRGPGVPEGSTTDALASNNDIAPTIASIVGAEIPDFVDGRSLVPLLDSNPANDVPWRTALLSQRGNGTWWALAEDDLTYIEREGGGRELYHLEEDPYEVENAYGSASEEEKARLHERLETIKGCAGEGCRTAEDGP